MKLVWVCLLLAILLVVVQGKSNRKGNRNSVKPRSSSTKTNLKKAAIVGAGVYGGYQVGNIGPDGFTFLFPPGDEGDWKVPAVEAY